MGICFAQVGPSPVDNMILRTWAFCGFGHVDFLGRGARYKSCCPNLPLGTSPRAERMIDLGLWLLIGTRLHKALPLVDYGFHHHNPD